MEGSYQYRLSRRSLLGAAVGLGLGALLLGDKPGCAAPVSTSSAPEDTRRKHNSWVWRFDVDGSPEEVATRLRSNGLGILLKTHESAEWMSVYDDSPSAISGPRKVREMADYFEAAGVPFHAWCVVQGHDPIGEARLCSEVLDSGARSLIFDLEPQSGLNYWQADGHAAIRFGRELRRLQPNALLGVAPDARPWQLDVVPIAEFASFSNEILPQTYWQTFDSPANRRYISERGFHVGPEGVTPELILDVTAESLRPYRLPIRPIGQGSASGPEWERFIRHAYSLNMDSVSVWRFGTAHNDVWRTLEALAPPQSTTDAAQSPSNTTQSTPNRGQTKPALTERESLEDSDSPFSLTVRSSQRSFPLPETGVPESTLLEGCDGGTG